MEYKYFGLKVFARIIILFISLLVLVLAITGNQNYVTSAVFFIIVILESAELIWFVNRINREIGHFIDAIRLKDYSMNYYPERSGPTFRPLRKALGQVLADLQQAREQEEANYLKLQIMIDHIDVAFLLIDSKENLKISNRAAVNLFSRDPGMDFLRTNHKELSDFIINTQAGEKKLYEMTSGGQRMLLSVRKSTFLDKTEEFSIISLQDIHFEMDAKEVDAWHKLIRVLTHEIMNSVTPLNSLSQALLEELNEANPDNLNRLLPDLRLSGETIYSRSKDLMKFISEYKRLTKLEKPVFEKTDLFKLIDQVEKLFATEFKKYGIAFRVKKAEGMFTFKADREMMMRVLINLVRNSIDALQNVGEPEISIDVINSGNGIILSFKDNGEGIPSEVLSEIFIPFFTTRKKGSGIGLSLSRRIMQLHGGSISVSSEAGAGTCFTLYFKRN